MRAAPTPFRGCLVAIVAALLLGEGGCRRPTRASGQTPARSRPGPAAKASPRPAHAPIDPGYAGTRPLWARAFLLRERLAPTTPRSFVRLAAAQRRELTRLQRQSRLTIKVYVTAERTLFVLPSTHPMASARVLLGANRGRIWVHTPDKWSYELPVAALPDVLDRTPRLSERRRHEPLRPSRLREARSTRRDVKTPPRSSPERSRLARQRLQLTLPYRYRAGGRGKAAWNLQIALRLDLRGQVAGWWRPPQPRSWPLAPLALPLAAPDDATLGEMLRSLPQGSGAVLGWLRVVDNQSLGSRPLRLRTTVRDLGWVQMPARHFSADQPGYRRSARLPPPRDGLQIIAGSQLARLRPRVDAPTPGAPPHKTALEVENTSTVAAFVHLDGVRIGWVAPGKTHRFSGMSAGYYRIVAHAPSGVRSWDPRDLYLPGKLTLR